MAKFSQHGLMELSRDLINLKEKFPYICEEALDEGAEKVKESWVKGIKATVKPNPPGRSTGDMADSVRIKKAFKNTSELLGSVSSSRVIGPDGYDEKNIPNMEKAYILNYGKRKSGQSPTYFVDDIEDEAADEAFTAMQEVVDKALKEAGF